MISWTAVEKKLKTEEMGREKYVDFCIKELKKYAFPEIEQNINEWAEDKPLTEIPVSDWSLKKIEMFYPNAHFIDMVECLCEYKETGCKKIRLSQFDMM